MAMRISGTDSTDRRALRHPRDLARDALIQDVLEQVCSGDLKPGQRVLSITRLCQTYSVTRHAATTALAVLIDQGILEAKEGSGHYVQRHAPTLAKALTAVPTARESLAGPEQSPSAGPGQYRAYTEPKRGPITLSLYVMDLYPRMVRFWRRVLNRYEAPAHENVRVRMLSCLDGHVEDLLADTSPDLLAVVPRILKHMGPEKFLPISCGAETGLAAGDLVGALPQAVRDGTEPLGVPFCFSVPALYLNRQLLGKMPDLRVPATVEELLDLAGVFHRRTGMTGIHLLPLLGLLLADGTVQAGPESCRLADPARARELLARATGGAVELDCDLELFLPGRSLMLAEYCFETIRVSEQAAFRWSVHPLPMGPQGRVEADTTFLAVSRNTRYPEECLSLIRYLCSHQVQREYGMLGGNFPVRASAALDEEVLAARPMSAADQRRMIDRALFNYDLDSFRLCGYTLSAMLKAGQSDGAPPDEAIAELEFMLARADLFSPLRM